MPGRPLLLLDVDGVLNPYAAATCPDGYAEYEFFAGEEPVRVCPEHGRWLRELATRFELTWAIAGDRPLAWLDEALAPEVREWAAERHVPTLLIDVDPAIGLTRQAVDECLGWASDGASSGRG